MGGLRSHDCYKRRGGTFMGGLRSCDHYKRRGGEGPPWVARYLTRVRMVLAT